MRLLLLVIVFVLFFTNACKIVSSQHKDVAMNNPHVSTIQNPISKVNPTPTWHIGDKCFLDGLTGTFDDLSVKDPSIVFYKNKYIIRNY